MEVTWRRGLWTPWSRPTLRMRISICRRQNRPPVLELAEQIWRKINGPDKPFRYVSDDPFEHDVARRVPATEKAEKVLGFPAATSLSEMLDGDPLDRAGD